MTNPIRFCLITGLVSAGPAGAAKIPENLPAKYRTWLEEVELLISSKKERKAFLELE